MELPRYSRSRERQYIGFSLVNICIGPMGSRLMESDGLPLSFACRRRHFRRELGDRVKAGSQQMSNSDVRNLLDGVICEVFEIPEDSLVLHDDLDLRYFGDSLKHLELLALVESKFGISIE